MITLDEKIEIVERFIRDRKFTQKGTDQHYDADILRALASDLRARKAPAPVAAVMQIERRMRAVENAKGCGYDPTPALVSLADETISRWPVIRQALERFGAEVEQ